MKEKLKQALSQRQKSRIDDARGIQSAVLVPLYFKEGKHHILFTRRTEKVKVHKGEISFPGGGYEKEDGNLLNTALRESAEEIGLMPGDVEVMGELDDYFTIGTGYIISPFVGIFPWPYPFKLATFETRELIEVPIEALLKKDSYRADTAEANGRLVDTYFYHYQDKVIWGATARILRQFLGIWVEAMGEKG